MYLIMVSNGKRTFVQVQVFEDLEEAIKHRSLNHTASYKHLIKLECYKLQKHLLEIEEYKPFKMWW
jgi:CRISPR-associated protein Cas1